MSIGSNTQEAREMKVFAVGGYKARSAFLQGHVAVYWGGSGQDNLDACLPNDADAVNGGRGFIGLWDNKGGPAVVYPGTSTQTYDVAAPVKLGFAPGLLKANTACTKGGTAAYDPADGGTIVPFTAANQVPIGRFAETRASSSSAQLVTVEVGALGSLLGAQRIYGIVADGTHTANVATEQAFTNGAYSIPANTAVAGQVFTDEGQILVSSQNGTDKLVARVKLGGTTIIATPAAYDPAANDLVTWDMKATFRTIGATAVVEVMATMSYGTAAAPTVIQARARLSLDTTAAIASTVTVQFDAASASNVCLLESLNLYLG